MTGFPRRRWTVRAGQLHRSEAGFLELGAAAVVTLGLAAAVSLVLIVQTLAEGAGGPRPSTVRVNPLDKAFIGPEPPGGSTNSCSIAAAASVEPPLTWTKFGWRKAAGDDEPVLYYFIVELRAKGKNERTATKAWSEAFTKWYDEMNSHAANATAEWERRKCGQPQAQLPKPEAVPPSINIAGTYQLTEEGYSPSSTDCGPYAGAAGTMVVTGPVYPTYSQGNYTQGSVSIALQGRFGSLFFPSTLEPGLNFFSISGQEPKNPNSQLGDTFALNGQFAAAADTVRVSGSFVVHGLGCTISFTGLRT